MIGQKHENILDSVVADMTRQGREITQASLRGFIMSRVVNERDERLGKLSGKPIHEYCLKHNIK